MYLPFLLPSLYLSPSLLTSVLHCVISSFLVNNASSVLLSLSPFYLCPTFFLYFNLSFLPFTHFAFHISVFVLLSILPAYFLHLFPFILPQSFPSLLLSLFCLMFCLFFHHVLPFLFSFLFVTFVKISFLF